MKKEDIEKVEETVKTETPKKKVVKKKDSSFKILVETPFLNIRKLPSIVADKTGEYTGTGEFEIVQVKEGPGSNSGWGKLKNGAGWVALDFVVRL